MLKITRRQTLKTLIAASPVAASINAFFIEPNRLTITRQEITLPNLPADLDGTTIAHLSDFHYKPDKDHALMEKVVAATNAEKVDFIALTGDYVTEDSSVLTPLLEHLSRLEAKHGIAAIMGNHDGWSDSQSYYSSAFEKASIPFLINQNTSIEISGSRLHIAGTDHIWLGNPDPVRTLKGIPTSAPTLTLVHEPDYWDTMRSHRTTDLQLSGHTHGGQCRVPLIGYTPVKVKYGKKYVYGHHSHSDSQLFVSRGTGTTGIRVRFACPPELAILTLRSPLW